jgi:hypothetical protein
MRATNLAHLFTFALALALLVTQAQAGPVAYGACQAGCATLAVACYSTAGFLLAIPPGAGAGIVLGAQPTVISCNIAFGTCSGACATAFLMPTP